MILFKSVQWCRHKPGVQNAKVVCHALLKAVQPVTARCLQTFKSLNNLQKCSGLEFCSFQTPVPANLLKRCVRRWLSIFVLLIKLR